MPKPFIIANGGSPGIKASVSAGSTVNFTLDSIIGVVSVQWSISSTDETSSPGDYTLVQSGTRGQNMSLTALGAGTAAIVSVQINSGLVRGLIDLENTTNTIKFFVPTAEGLEVGAAGETYESDATNGTTGILNQPIRVLNVFTTSLYENDVKRAVASAIANVSLSGDPSPMDGVTVVTGDVVFLAGQTATEQNGLWQVNTAGAWSRPDNFTTTEAVKGSVIAVIEGTDRKGFFYQNTNVNDPVVGTDALSFARLPDRFDRADLALASASPASTILVRYGSASELNAAYLTSNGTNPAQSGFVRSPKNTVGLAFRNDANTDDVEAVSMDATDVLRYGSTGAEQLQLSVKSAGEIRLLSNATAFLRAASSGVIFGRTATATFSQETNTTGAGSDMTIRPQQGHTGSDGGNLVLLPGDGGSGGNLGQIIIGDSAADTTRIKSNLALFGTGQFGGGEGVLSIEAAAVVPSTNPTTAGIIYVESDYSLRYRQPDGTVSQIAPNAVSVGNDFAYSPPRVAAVGSAIRGTPGSYTHGISFYTTLDAECVGGLGYWVPSGTELVRLELWDLAGTSLANGSVSISATGYVSVTWSSPVSLTRYTIYHITQCVSGSGAMTYYTAGASGITLPTVSTPFSAGHGLVINNFSRRNTAANTAPNANDVFAYPVVPVFA